LRDRMSRRCEARMPVAVMRRNAATAWIDRVSGVGENVR
jgi:hypothetical protein